jgi:membrane protease YdiL (CAAX protease family)
MTDLPLPSELPEAIPTQLQQAPLDVLPEPEAYPFWGYKDLFVLLALVIVVAALGLAVVAFLSSIWPSRVLMLVLSQSLVYGPGLLVLYGIVRVRYGRPFWQSMRWQSSGATMRKWGLAGVGTAIAGSLLAAAIGARNIDELPINELLSSRLTIAVIGVLAVTIGPLWEELTFRGFLLPLLTKTIGSPMAIVVSATAFSLMHGPQYGWSWQALLPVGFAGVCFGIARVVTGSTGVAVGMHAMYNLTVFSAFLAQRGVDNLPWQ